MSKNSIPESTLKDLRYWREKWLLAEKERDPRDQRLQTSASMAMLDTYLDKYNVLLKQK